MTTDKPAESSSLYVYELPMTQVTAMRLIWFGFIMTVLATVFQLVVGSSLFARWPMVIQVFGLAGAICSVLSHYFNRRAPSSVKPTDG